MIEVSKILIVGLGSIGRRHLKILRKMHPNADIRVLIHRSKNSIPEYSNGIFEDLNEVIRYKPQIAVIASPATFHLNISIALAKIGCSLLIEKPISNDSKRIKDLIDIRDEKDLFIQLGYNLRFDNSLIYFRQQIQSNLIGEIYSIRCEAGSYLPSWRVDTDYKKSVSANAHLGGGVILELSHEIDYLRWIFGEITSVNALIKKHSNLDIDVEDTAYITLNLKSNNKKDLPVAILSLDFIRHDPTRTCIAIGEKGSLKWNEKKGLVEIWKINDHNWTELFSHNKQEDETYNLEWKSFFKGLYDKKKPLVTVEDGLSVINIIEAARTSNMMKYKTVKLNNV